VQLDCIRRKRKIIVVRGRIARVPIPFG